MSFIQCKDMDEVEKTLKGRNAFVSEDFRIYTEIELWDDVARTKLNPDVIEALMSLKQTVEMIGEPGFEMSFRELTYAAKLAEDAYEKVAAVSKGKKP